MSGAAAPCPDCRRPAGPGAIAATRRPTSHLVAVTGIVCGAVSAPHKTRSSSWARGYRPRPGSRRRHLVQRGAGVRWPTSRVPRPHRRPGGHDRLPGHCCTAWSRYACDVGRRGRHGRRAGARMRVREPHVGGETARDEVDLPPHAPSCGSSGPPVRVPGPRVPGTSGAGNERERAATGDVGAFGHGIRSTCGMVRTDRSNGAVRGWVVRTPRCPGGEGGSDDPGVGSDHGAGIARRPHPGH
jgi:hypothetical protein